MKVKEFDIGCAHVEFYDDQCVTRQQSNTIYEGLSKYVFHIKIDKRNQEGKFHDS